MDQYAALFGLGQSTGFELGEYTGQVAGPETSQRHGNTWYGGLLLTASIGQGDTLCTPLQMTNYIATLVNGGYHYTPHLLRSVKSNDYSQTLYDSQPTGANRLDLDPENLEAVKYGMWRRQRPGEQRIPLFPRSPCRGGGQNRHRPGSL